MDLGGLQPPKKVGHRGAPARSLIHQPLKLHPGAGIAGHGLVELPALGCPVVYLVARHDLS
jgi:hypothetical protein